MKIFRRKQLSCVLGVSVVRRSCQCAGSELALGALPTSEAPGDSGNLEGQLLQSETFSPNALERRLSIAAAKVLRLRYALTNGADTNGDVPGPSGVANGRGA